MRNESSLDQKLSEILENEKLMEIIGDMAAPEFRLPLSEVAFGLGGPVSSLAEPMMQYLDVNINDTIENLHTPNILNILSQLHPDPKSSTWDSCHSYSPPRSIWSQSDGQVQPHFEPDSDYYHFPSQSTWSQSDGQSHVEPGSKDRSIYEGVPEILDYPYQTDKDFVPGFNYADISNPSLGFSSTEPHTDQILAGDKASLAKQKGKAKEELHDTEAEKFVIRVARKNGSSTCRHGNTERPGAKKFSFHDMNDFLGRFDEWLLQNFFDPLFSWDRWALENPNIGGQCSSLENMVENLEFLFDAYDKTSAAFFLVSNVI